MLAPALTLAVTVIPFSPLLCQLTTVLEERCLVTKPHRNLNPAPNLMVFSRLIGKKVKRCAELCL